MYNIQYYGYRDTVWTYWVHNVSYYGEWTCGRGSKWSLTCLHYNTNLMEIVQNWRTLWTHYWRNIQILVSLIVDVYLHLLVKLSFHFEWSLYTSSIVFPRVIMHTNQSNVRLSVNHTNVTATETEWCSANSYSTLSKEIRKTARQWSQWSQWRDQRFCSGHSGRLERSLLRGPGHSATGIVRKRVPI